MEHKRVHVSDCSSILYLVKAIMQVTGKSLLESKNIVDIIRDTENRMNLNGTLLLNESSITPQQWEEIVSKDYVSIKWEYV